MFFGLTILFAIIPIIVILTILWIKTGKTIFAKSIVIIICSLLLLSILGFILRHLNSKTMLDKDDYYGTYIIDRSYFPGKQADWQYNNFRFEIKSNDSIYFYNTNKEMVIRTYKGSVSFPVVHKSARLHLSMNEPIHHITISDPIIHRKPWSFYMTFKSPLYNNMYFKKGNWKPIPQ